MTRQTIELDCAPFTARPDIAKVIEGTGLPTREPTTKLFGNWTYDYSDIPAETWTRAQAVIKPRVIELYLAGFIRYGSW